MKNSKGISLITLIITVVAIIILASITQNIEIGDNIDETENTMYYNEIFTIKEAIEQRGMFNKINSSKYPLVGTLKDTTISIDMLSGDEMVKEDRLYKASDGWYTIDSAEFEVLSIHNVKQKYLVNYETGEVISLKPIYYNDRSYYSASDLKEAINNR